MEIISSRLGVFYVSFRVGSKASVKAKAPFSIVGHGVSERNKCHLFRPYKSRFKRNSKASSAVKGGFREVCEKAFRALIEGFVSKCKNAKRISPIIRQERKE